MDTEWKGRLKATHSDKEQSAWHRREIPQGLWATPRGQAGITLDLTHKRRAHRQQAG